MDRRGELLTLVRHVYRAATDATQWGPFIEGLSDLFGGSVAGLHHYGDAAQGVRATFVRMDPAALADYVSHYSALSPWIAHGRRIWEPGLVLAADSYVRLDDLKPSEFYNDFLAPKDVAHCVGACLSRRDGVCSNLTVTRSLTRGPFQDAELRLIRLLLPHVRQALDLHERLGDLRAAHAAAEDVLDRLPQGVMVLDACGRPLFVNRAASTVVAQRDGLSITGGHVEVGRPAERQALRGLLHRAAQASAGESLRAGGAMAVSRPSMKRPYSILVTPLRLPIASEAEAAATLVVSDPDRPSSLDMRTVTQAYGLSPAESCVVDMLAVGESLERVADRLCLSPDTVRWHVKRIYRKTGTTRLAALVRLLLNGSMARPAQEPSFARQPVQA